MWVFDLNNSCLVFLLNFLKWSVRIGFWLFDLFPLSFFFPFLEISHFLFSSHQGIVQASFWGLGFGGGSIIGGFSFRVFGERETFRGFAVASISVLVFFLIVQFILSSAEKQNDASKYNALSNKEEIPRTPTSSGEEDNE